MPRIACAAVPLLFLLLAGCATQPEAKKAEAPRPAPDVFEVRLETSKGPITVEVRKEWAPRGAERFHLLVSKGFFNEVRFHRVVRKFIAQFGINGKPAVNRFWQTAFIPDDPIKMKNKRGWLSFAKSGPNSRTTQVFINLADNPSLDAAGFVPFGHIIAGEDVLDKLYFGYGELPPAGSGPQPERIESGGNEYLETRFPRLDYIREAVIVGQ